MTSAEFDDIIAKNGSLANAFKAGALPVRLIIDAIKDFAKGIDTATKPVQVATDQLEYFNKVVGKVIRGDFGNGEERVKALTAAGYDNVTVQKLVNKIWERNGKTWDNVTLTSEELTEVIGALSSEELQNIGYTKEQANALKELAIQAEQTGTPLNDLIESLNKPSGRELLISSISNAFTGFKKVLDQVRIAWEKVFPPASIEERSARLYNLIEAVHSFSESLIPSTKTLTDLMRTLRGVFALVDIVTTIFGGAFKIAFEVFRSVLGMADLDILGFTAILGDAVYNLRNFIVENEFVTKTIDTIASGIVSAAKSVKEWIDAFLDLPFVQDAIENLTNGLKDLKDVGKDAIAGLQNGLSEGLTSIPEILINIGKSLLEAIKGFLGINSPSTKMYEVGQFTIEGLVEGLKSGLSAIGSVLQSIATYILSFLQGIPWGSVVAAGISVGLLYVAKNLIDVMGAVTAPLEGFGDLLSGAGEVLEKSAKSISKVIKGFANVMNAYAMSIRADALKSIAIAIGILAASIFVLSRIETEKLFISIGALAALAAVIGTLGIALGKFGPESALSFGGFALAVVGISASILIMAAALKQLNSLDPEKSMQTIIGFVGIVAALATILTLYGKLVSNEASKNIGQVGTMMLKLSISMLLMVAVIKLISGMDAEELIKGGIAITAFVAIVGLLTQVTKIGKGQTMAKLGSTLLAMSASLLIMVAVVKLISGMEVGELVKGGVVIASLCRDHGFDGADHKGRQRENYGKARKYLARHVYLNATDGCRCKDHGRNVRRGYR